MSHVKERIVLAYSGDVESSVAIPWLLRNHRVEIVTVTLDLGQGRELEELRGRALAAGAARAHVLDLRDEFARDFMLPTLKAGTLCRDGRPMAAALARPLIAKTLCEIARIENARSVAHASSGSALDTLVRALDADLRVVTPVREGAMTSAEAIRYARGRGVRIAAEEGGHVNLWGRTVRKSDLPDTGEEPEDLYTMTRSAITGPEMPALLEIAFEQGVPVSINGVPMPLTELIESLGLIAGQHGVGRMEWTGPRHDATVSRTTCEAPAAHVLHAAHEDVGALTLPGDLGAIQRDLRPAYADLVHSGRWFTPLREALDAFHARAQSRVSGVSCIRLFKGRAHVMERKRTGVSSNTLSGQEMVSHS